MPVVKTPCRNKIALNNLLHAQSVATDSGRPLRARDVSIPWLTILERAGLITWRFQSADQTGDYSDAIDVEITVPRNHSNEGINP